MSNYKYGQPLLIVPFHQITVLVELLCVLTHGFL